MNLDWIIMCRMSYMISHHTWWKKQRDHVNLTSRKSPTEWGAPLLFRDNIKRPTPSCCTYALLFLSIGQSSRSDRLPRNVKCQPYWMPCKGLSEVVFSLIVIGPPWWLYSRPSPPGVEMNRLQSWLLLDTWRSSCVYLLPLGAVH